MSRARRPPRPPSAPASDRDRTVFAGMEAVAGAALALVGGQLLSVRGFGAVAGTALLALGAMAVLQSVAIGLGLVKLPPRRGDPTDRDG